MNRPNLVRDHALVLFATLLWGFSGGLAGLLMARGWDPLILCFHRATFGLVSIAAWLLLARPRSPWPNRRLLAWPVVAGLGVAGNFAFYFLSIRAVGVAVAVTLMFCAPVLVFLISFLFRWERLTAFKGAVAAVVVVGIVLLTDVRVHNLATFELWGTSAGLLAGLSYAVFIFGFKAAARQGSPPQVLVVALATVILVLFPLVDPATLLASFAAPDLPWFVLLGVLGAGLSFPAYITGLRRTAPTVAAVVGVAEPVTASLFGVLMLGETLLPTQFAGMAVIFVTVTLIFARRTE